MNTLFIGILRCKAMFSLVEQKSKPVENVERNCMLSEMLRAFEHSLIICLVGATAVVIIVSYCTHSTLSLEANAIHACVGIVILQETHFK